MKNKRNIIVSAQTPDEKWSLWEAALKDKGKSLRETLIQENVGKKMEQRK